MTTKLGSYTKHQLLLKQYVNAQVDLGNACIGFLQSDCDADLSDLRVGLDVASVKYKGEWTDIRVIDDRVAGSNELVLSFYSDDIPGLHMPYRLILSDEGGSYQLFTKMFTAYEEWTYRNVE